MQLIERVKEQKWRWTGHVARTVDNRQSKKVTGCTTRSSKNSKLTLVYRPYRKCRDDTDMFAGR